MRGVGAARKWIYEQFRSYSPRLEVSYDQYRLKKDPARGSRIPDDVDFYNVVAVLPGTTDKEERIIVSGHYDTINMTRPAGTPAPKPGDPPLPIRERRRSRRYRRWQRHRLRDGTGARAEPV